MTADEVAKDIVDAAMKVHRALGPGLLESAYQSCLADQLVLVQKQDGERILPIHLAQLLTYLKLSRLSWG